MNVSEESERIIDSMLNHAREAYDQETQVLKNCFQKYFPELEAITAPMDDPLFIQDKEFALRICHMLTTIGLESGKIEKGSIAHKSGLRLYDYILREIKD